MAEVRVNVQMNEVVAEVHRLVLRADATDMRLVAEELKLAMDDKIQAEGQVASFPRWPELAEATKRGREKLGRSAKMLQVTGLLANIQTDQSTDDVALAESPAPYAGFHVTGTDHHARRDFTEIDWDTTLENVGVTILDRIVG